MPERTFFGRAAIPGAIASELIRLARRYPPELIEGQLADVERIAFHIGLIAGAVPAGGHVCDIGGGIGLFSVGCAALGYDAVLVDDFGDEVNLEHGDPALSLHKDLGVTVIRADVLADQSFLADRSFDAVTSFDSIEHWHHSPRALFAAVRTALKQDGLFLLGAPNRANLRKRLAVPFGGGRWSPMREWYEQTPFRGHVREPDLEDFRHIAADMGFAGYRLFGRNWLGYSSKNGFIRNITPFVDYPLRIFPSLCSDLYLMARKPGG